MVSHGNNGHNGHSSGWDFGGHQPTPPSPPGAVPLYGVIRPVDMAPVTKI